MKNYIYLCLAILLFAVSSCNDEQEKTIANEGRILIQVDMTNIEPATKAYLPGIGVWNPEEVCTIEILQGEELIESFTGLSSIPESLTLPTGEYTLKVTAGEEKGASFTECFYESETTFSVTAGETTSVQLVCKLKNVLATIHFSDNLISLIEEDFQVYIIGETAEDKLIWNGQNQGSTGYFTLEEVTKLSWAVEGSLNGKTISSSKRAGTISPVKPNTNYVLTFNYDEQLETPDLSFILEIKESDPQDDIIDYIPETEIDGGDFDLREPLSIEKGSEQDVVVNINTPYAATSILVSVNDATKNAFELTVNSFDFMAMDAGEIASYAAKGILFESTPVTRAESEISYSITIDAEKVKELDAGDYSFDIAVTNEKNKTSQATLTLKIIDESGNGEIPVETDDIILSDVWAKRATLKATLLSETSETFTFDYRINGETSWTSVVGAVNNGKVIAEITGLKPATTYEYRVNAGDQNGEVKTFTTEAAAQLPNSGFEQWQQPKKPWLLYEGGEENMFWDSGNHGATTISEKSNLTTPDDTKLYVNSGTYSAKLVSNRVGGSGIFGRFAAGNLFAGEYVRTITKIAIDAAATAGGELAFGREFTSRPTKVKFYYKYIAGTIDNIDTRIDIPQSLIDEGAKKGLTDKAHVYVALSDKGSPYTIINTTAGGDAITLFDKNDENIIAYGEFVKSESSAGDGLIEYTIDLDYRFENRIPTHIIVVCSASKYGDYFSGASGSTLWLDDFELIYE